jgi:hypothetical protein
VSTHLGSFDNQWECELLGFHIKKYPRLENDNANAQSRCRVRRYGKYVHEATCSQDIAVSQRFAREQTEFASPQAVSQPNVSREPHPAS